MTEPFDIERIARLRDVTQRVCIETPLGPIEEEILNVYCDGCGWVKKLNMDRFGLDWPDELEGWCTVPGVGDLCPSCTAQREVVRSEST